MGINVCLNSAAGGFLVPTSRQPRLFTLLFLLPLTAATPIATRAGELIVSNLYQASSPPQSNTIAPLSAGGQNGYAAAQEFTTSEAATPLDGIIASLGHYNAGDGTFKLYATLVADNNASPTGQILTTFSVDPSSFSTSGFQNILFRPLSSVNLAGDTAYWFVLSAASDNGSGSMNWEWTNSTVTHGQGTLPNTAGLDSSGWTVFSNEPFLIQAGGTVPEPASWILILMSTGVAGLKLLDRLSRKSAGV